LNPRFSICKEVAKRVMNQKPAERKSPIKLPQYRMPEAEYVGGDRLQVAMDHGFVPTDLASTEILCEHPHGDTLLVYRNGSWIHRSSSGKGTEGRGCVTLRTFLQVVTQPVHGRLLLAGMLNGLRSDEYFEPPPPPPPPLPTVTFSAKPSTAEKGQLVTISWASENATDVCLELGTRASTVGPHGCEFVRLQDSTTFTLTATGPGGTQRATARVTVILPAPPPQASSPQKRQSCSKCHKPFPL
jgi:hypothetical protein